uniref:Uncharacterized protein n=1 Tax=Solanum lycopersicum TaxID=4081 RepID=A0A3Q7G7X7_SOLLC
MDGLCLFNFTPNKKDLRGILDRGLAGCFFNPSSSSREIIEAKSFIEILNPEKFFLQLSDPLAHALGIFNQSSLLLFRFGQILSISWSASDFFKPDLGRAAAISSSTLNFISPFFDINLDGLAFRLANEGTFGKLNFGAAGELLEGSFDSFGGPNSA